MKNLHWLTGQAEEHNGSLSSVALSINTGTATPASPEDGGLFWPLRSPNTVGFNNVISHQQHRQAHPKGVQGTDSAMGLLFWFI